MNKTIKTLLALAGLLAVINTASAGVKKIGTLNGFDVYRIKNMGLFCPSTTTTVLADPKKPGTIEGVVSSASGTSVLGSVAAPAATAASAYLHKPDTTTVSQSGGGASATSNADASAKSKATGGAGGVGNGGAGGAGGNGTANGGGQFVPPGHINNPSSNN
jgi:hypothetical protein